MTLCYLSRRNQLPLFQLTKLLQQNDVAMTDIYIGSNDIANIVFMTPPAFSGKRLESTL